MPNGGPTPDCAHCQWFNGSFEEARCEHHGINLPIPIRAFCASYTRPAEMDHVEALIKKVAWEQLDAGMMYLWLDPLRSDGTAEFFYVPLVSIAEYNLWTREKFFDELGKIGDQYRR